MRKVYKVLVIRRKRVRGHRDISNYKGFWKYFYSLSELAAWMSKISPFEFYLPDVIDNLSKEERYILAKKMNSDTCINMITNPEWKELRQLMRR